MDTNTTKHPNVLVVEDDPAYQRILEIYIHRAGGSCDCLFDGKSALDTITGAKIRSLVT